MKLLRLSLLMVFMIPSMADAVFLPEENFSDMARTADSILLVEVKKAESVEDGKKWCGTRYTAKVDDVVKGSGISNDLTFFASESLMASERYVVFFEKGLGQG